jgi:hypothetical protein
MDVQITDHLIETSTIYKADHNQSIPAMKPLELRVPIPDIGPIEIFKRFRWKAETIWDVSCAIQATFSPPKSTRLWPKTIGDIGERKTFRLTEILSRVKAPGPGANRRKVDLILS